MSVTRGVVSIIKDTLDEDDETLTVEAYDLENAQGSSSDLEATITIVDDDPTPTVTVADAAATEGDKVEFVVTLSAVSGRDVEVGYATSVETGDTAVSGTDFTATTGTLTILAADSTDTGTVEVQTTEDDASESAETFTLTLSATKNVELGMPSTAAGTIEDDDAAAGPTVTDVAVTSTPVLETDTYGAGEEILFTVTFSEAVDVTGDPEFAFSLDSGEDRAPYKSGSGTTALVFAHTVAPGDEDDDGIFLLDGSDFNNRDGAVTLDSDDAIKAAGSTTDADLAHTAGRGTQSGHKVDGSRSIVSVEVTSTPMLETDTYGATETIQFTVTFTAAVDVTGDPVLEFLFDGSEVRQAGDVSGSGTTELVFGYTVVSGDDDDNGLFLRDESDYNNPDGPVRLDSDDEIEFKDTSTDAPLYWSGRGTQSGHKVDGSRTTGNNPPSFSSSATFDAAENQTAVGTVEAADSDADDSVTGYAITGGADQALFEIGATTGELTFKSAPNYEDPQDSGTDNDYVVTVQATSGTGPREMTATRTFTVTVTDVAEQSAKPDKPTLAAVSGSTTSLTATWTKPDLNGGPDITGYDLQYRAGATGTWSSSTSYGATVTTATITGLTADTSYQAQVLAKNGETDSDWSDASDAVSTNAGTALPTLSIADAEGDEDDGVEFTATLTSGVSGKVTATWTATIESDDTASAADLATAKTGEVEFDENATTANFTVQVNDDTTDEPDQTFTLTLSGVSSNAQLAADPTAKGTIDDDDAPPTVDIADATAIEGDDVEFTVTLSAASEKTVTVRSSSSVDPGDTASDADFASGFFFTTIFDPGQDEKTVTVQTVDDVLDEDAETFTLEAGELINVRAGDIEATGTITDNDPTPTVTVADAEATEGDKVAFTVTLSAVSGRDVEVGYATSVETGDTAVSGTDFTTATGTLTILAADSTATGTVEVQTTDDTDIEGDETFTVTLSNPSNATISDATAKGTINDDDDATNAAPSISSSATFNAAENQTTVGTVLAMDSDSEDATTGYAITGGADQDFFSIGATSGALTFDAAPNYEDAKDQGSNNTYVVDVTATSGTGTRGEDRHADHHGDGDRRERRGAGQAGQAEGVGGVGDQPEGELVGAVQRGSGDHRLRRAVPGGHERDLEHEEPQRHGHSYDADGADGGHPLPGAGAGQERRGHGRVVGLGQRHAGRGRRPARRHHHHRRGRGGRGRSQGRHPRPGLRGKDRRRRRRWLGLRHRLVCGGAGGGPDLPDRHEGRASQHRLRSHPAPPADQRDLR